jgi:hypothetical protein
MKKALALATVALLASSLAACGGSDDNNSSGGTGSSGSYCDEVQAAKDAIVGGSNGSLTQANFDDLQSKLGDIEADAPGDAADDWKTFGGYLDQLEGLLKDAGLSLDDLQGLEAGQTPKGLDPAALTTLATKMSQLSSSGDLQATGKSLTASVKKDCNIDLDDDSATASSGP